ncbi:beta-galactosidase [Bifidobacterium choloepi]|uniref:Beta-galactosidase n=1 Tax=Bifidobacterium choloepi TaxID=2614131 RepID=A0A6I5N9Q2_9BIFI|nr:beta-galactosidase [Bifidobacterium choloepi]NEG70521.1 beta-galactosidase [Bifidobacterium choloepi]
MLYGGDWNPEQWPEETWEHDLELLEQAGVNEATINVFSWGLLQPDEETYDFSMLDRIVELLDRHGFSIVMATGTAAIPAWMARQYPGVMRTGIDGRRQLFGGRHNFCPSSPDYRRFAAGLASLVAERYVGDEHVVAWHVNNEYGNGGGYCYCERCAVEFREWLRKKYGTIDRLNEAWCMNFWSHTLHDWDDVVPPVLAGDAMGPDKCVISGLQMDYRRFQGDQFLDCFRLERDAIRRFDPVVDSDGGIVHDSSSDVATRQPRPITTNLMGTFKDFDYFQWGREMDVVSWDNYPGMTTPPSFTAMVHDLMRGVGGGKPFMLMEQTPNQQNWFPYCKVKEPGEVAKLSWQAVAHGASTVQFFQLRQSRGGCERFHGAVIGHDDSSRSRTYREVAKLGAALADSPVAAALSDIGAASAGVHADVAMMFDWDSYWSLEGCVGPTQGLRYPDEVHRFYEPFWERHVAVDFIPSTTPASELARYRVVVAPAMIVVKPGVASALGEYVRGGGRFVTGYMAGLHDEHDLIVPGGYPGELRPLVGAWVEEIDALAPDEAIPVVPVGPGESCHANDASGAATTGDVPATSGGIVASIIEPEGAATLAVYGGDRFYAGTPAVTRNVVGDGAVTFVGTALAADGMQAVLDSVMADAGVTGTATSDGEAAPDGVEVSCRHLPDGRTATFAINVTDQPVGDFAPFEVRTSLE